MTIQADPRHGHGHAHTHARVGIEAASREDPSQTVTARRRYAQKLRGAIRDIRQAAREGIRERDVLSIEAEALVDAPPVFDFERDAAKEEAFREWFDAVAEREVVETFGRENEFIRSGYERGLRNANRDLRQSGIDGLGEIETTLERPIHREQLEAVYTRNFRALKGITDDVGSDISRELSEGLAAGEGTDDIARRITDTLGRVDDGTPRGAMARATTIARTEVLNSHHNAVITQYEEFGVDRVEVLLAPDACDLCLELAAGAPYDPRELLSQLPRHPNCRCAPAVHTS